MDSLSHGLWAAVAAKATNKILRQHGRETRVNPWWAGFWGAFPDVFAFAPLFLWVFVRIMTGAFNVNDFVSGTSGNHAMFPVSQLTGALYNFSHSGIVFAAAFVLAWLIFRRPAWAVGGWLLHVLMDIPTHPASFYPTSFLWPLSDIRLGGISWATPWFLIIDYAVLIAAFFLLREKPTLTETVTPRERTKKIVQWSLFGAFVFVVALSTYAALHARRGQEPPLVTGNPSASANIIVAAPQPGATVGLPLTITGKARAFENTFSYRIRDENNSVLFESNAMTDAEDAGILGNGSTSLTILSLPKDFSLSVNYPEPKSTRGTVEVFEYSAKDGEEINKVAVPIVFDGNVEAQTVNVYFSSRAEDQEAMRCNETYPVARRIPKTQAPARTALEELLKGPDRVESGRGFFTSINPGVKINSLAIADGVARADFDAMMEAGMGGSCRVTAIRSQITNTLKQFPAVREVIIGVEGRVEDALQP
ncbi:MAG: Gmad2 immunoglobulin-like domain-containing protein [Candidatus Jorgensenbacteria bacterium]